MRSFLWQLNWMFNLFIVVNFSSTSIQIRGIKKQENTKEKRKEQEKKNWKGKSNGKDATEKLV